MKVKDAVEITGGLGFTQKTGMAFGLPAVVACKTGSKLAQVKGSVCFGCYACQGRYRIPTVVSCQTGRLETVLKLHDRETFNRWVEAMVLLISRENEKKKIGTENKGYFRWHDAGDVVSIDHLEAIVEIAHRLPKIRFWLPTKESGTVKEWMDKGGEIPENLCIRISGLMVDKKAKTVKGLPVSNVHTKKPLGNVCPAIEVHSGCGKLGCRKCWDKKVKAVSYKKH